MYTNAIVCSLVARINRFAQTESIISKKYQKRFLTFNLIRFAQQKRQENCLLLSIFNTIDARLAQKYNAQRMKKMCLV